MGKPLKEEIELDGLKVDREFINPFDGKVLVADIGKDFILEELENSWKLIAKLILATPTPTPQTQTTMTPQAEAEEVTLTSQQPVVSLTFLSHCLRNLVPVSTPS